MTLPDKHAMSYLSLYVSYHLQFMPLYKSKNTASVRGEFVGLMTRVQKFLFECQPDFVNV